MLAADIHRSLGDLPPGSVFAGHRIEAWPGAAGWASSIARRQLALDRIVALKVIAPACWTTRRSARRFVRESRVAASIDHPNVIPIYYAGEEDGVAVHRDALRRRRRPAHARPPRGAARAERAARIIGQVGAALDAAHAAGLVHRDVKPANVLLGRRRPRLPDRLRADQARAVVAGRDEARALGRHARLRRARADPRRAGRRPRRRLRARLRPLLHAHRPRAVPARGRRGAAVGAPLGAAADAERAVPALPRRSTT